MPDQHLLPIALPRGRRGNLGYLTVFFAPRLKEPNPAPQQLANYPLWRNWPTTLASLNVRARLTSQSGQVGWTEPTLSSVQPDPGRWLATFPANMPVKPHRFVDWSNPGIRTVATSDFNEAVLDLYTSIAAANPQQPPPGSKLLDNPNAAVLSGEPLAAAMSYVEPMAANGAARLEEPRDPQWDFHDYISLLGAHPELLRYLGLAVDYTIRIDKPVSIGIRTGFENQYAGAGAREVMLETQTTPDFFALPNPDPGYQEQTDGFLSLHAQDAFLSILDTYTSATRLAGLDERVADGEGWLPALSTRALTLVRPDLRKAFANRTTRQMAIEEAVQDQLYQGSGEPVVLYAEDVSIGQRIDVLHLDEDTNVWRSLFERETDDAGYQFVAKPALNVQPCPDEGWTQTLLVTEH